MLLLNGHGIDVRVSGAKLHIKNGRTSSTEEPDKPFTLNSHVRERLEIWEKTC